jgi:pimeloyl-ACP methyl ester carboxylesterase
LFSRKRTRTYWLRLIGFVPVALVIVLTVFTFIGTFVTAHFHLSPYRVAIIRPADLPASFEDIAFAGGDNLTLRGWFAPPRNDAVVILLHGYYSTRHEMRFHARTLHDAGYGVLLYDERASGESQGDQRSFGWKDVDDVGGALSFLKGRAGWIGLMGCSIGGQIALRATVQYPEIRAVLADGPSIVTAGDLLTPVEPIDVYALMYHDLTLRFVELRSGVRAPAPMMETIHKIAPRPVLLFAGEKGSELGRIRAYQTRAGGNAQLWEVPGAHHCDGPSVVPDEYARRLIAFFDSARQEQ